MIKSLDYICRDRQVGIRHIQKEMLRMLLIIDEVCRTNGLTYWIDGGTLLGAVRYNDFIPWDDDLDICLMKNDYDKLLNILNQKFANNGRYKLFYFKSGKYYWSEYIASLKFLIKTNDVIKPCRIDIVPMKSLDIAEIKLDKKIVNIAYYFISGIVKDKNKFDNKYLSKTLNQALIKKGRFMEYFNEMYLAKHSKLSAEKYIDYAFNDSLVSKTRKPFKYDEIFPVREIEFSGHKVFCPNNTDAYLTKMYGVNFKTRLPKKSERVPAGDAYYIVDERIGKEYLDKYLKENDEYFFYSSKAWFLIKKFLISLRQSGAKKTIFKIKQFINSK